MWIFVQTHFPFRLNFIIKFLYDWSVYKWIYSMNTFSIVEYMFFFHHIAPKRRFKIPHAFKKQICAHIKWFFRWWFEVFYLIFNLNLSGILSGCSQVQDPLTAMLVTVFAILINRKCHQYLKLVSKNPRLLNFNIFWCLTQTNLRERLRTVYQSCWIFL